jgi:hypothetical protein
MEHLLLGGTRRPGRDPTDATAASPTLARRGFRRAPATPERLSGDPVITVKRKERRPDPHRPAALGAYGEARVRNPRCEPPAPGLRVRSDAHLGAPDRAGVRGGPAGVPPVWWRNADHPPCFLLTAAAGPLDTPRTRGRGVKHTAGPGLASWAGPRRGCGVAGGGSGSKEAWTRSWLNGDSESPRKRSGRSGRPEQE